MVGFTTLSSADVQRPRSLGGGHTASRSGPEEIVVPRSARLLVDVSITQVRKTATTGRSQRLAKCTSPPVKNRPALFNAPGQKWGVDGQSFSAVEGRINPAAGRINPDGTGKDGEIASRGHIFLLCTPSTWRSILARAFTRQGYGSCQSGKHGLPIWRSWKPRRSSFFARR